jgi:flagellar biosynthesis protein FlhF
VRLKSYFADTIEAAMTAAARELGDDALLVYSREASPEAKYLGGQEVVFALPEPEVRTGQHLPPPEIAVGPVQGGTRPPDGDQLTWATSALAELRNEIGSLREDVASHRRYMEDLLTVSDRRAWRLLADWGSEPELLPGVALAGRLLQADMDPEHVLDLIESTRDALRANDAEISGPDGWRRALERELTDRRRCDSRFGSSGASSGVVLIGPPGSGKTTVAMQLAALATGKGMEPRLIAFEPGRLTAAQALRSYAAVLGAPFELTRRGEHLASLLSGREPGNLTIVDGPGVGFSADEGAAQLAAFRNHPRQTDIWLVLPATLRATDLRLLIERFAGYSPTRLVFTRTAEASHWGAIWSAAEWAGLPIAFFCDGPCIPEDLRTAASEAITTQLLAATAPPRRSRSIKIAEPARVSGRG